MTHDIFPWKQMSSRVAYKNPWITVREDLVIRPDGTKGIYGVIMCAPVVMIVAVTNRAEVYLIGQHRYPVQAFSWELPGGSSDGEDVLAAAKRELQEETGATADRWTKIGSLQSISGLSNAYSHIFLAQTLSHTGINKQAEDGISHMRVVPFLEVIAMIQRGQISDAQTIAGIFLAGMSLGLLNTS